MKLAALLLAATTAGAAESYWLQQYSVPAHDETRTAELVVKSADELAKAPGLVEINGGVFAAALDSFVSAPDRRQLAFTLEKARAKELEKALKKLGKLSVLATRPQPLPKTEIRERLARLRDDQKKKELAGLPAASGLVADMVAHLTTLDARVGQAEKRSLWNLTVRIK